MLVSSRFRRSAFCSDAATLANRVRCHCHDVRTWLSADWVPKGGFRVHCLGPFSGTVFTYTYCCRFYFGAVFRSQNEAGQGSKNGFVPHFLSVKKTACAQIRARSDRPGRSKNLYMKVALFEHVTHYKLRAHLLDNFQGAATGCGRPKPLLSASSAPSIGSPIFSWSHRRRRRRNSVYSLRESC